VSGFLRTIADYAVMLAIVFAALILGEWLPFMRRLDAAIAASRPLYLTPAIVLLVVGWGGFFAAIIYGAVSGTPSRRMGQPMPDDTAEPAARGSFDVEVSFAEVMEAWRQRRWRTNRAWRTTFLMMAAAFIAVTGMFATAFVLAPGGMRVLIAAAFLYAAAMTVYGLCWRRYPSETGAILRS
jgi:hypothetical protein